MHRVMIGDCLDRLAELPGDSVDLIVTSPPYADQRKNTYGGIAPDEYVAWFMPRADGMRRALKPSGSLILNIKERIVDGERSTYVLELILAMRRNGWLWTEEYVWHKKNAMPGKWAARFRDSWERLLHFTKRKDFRMFQDAVRVPAAEHTLARVRHLSAADWTRNESKTRSGFGKSMANWIGRDLVYPTNVLQLATENGNKNHSAVFPEAIPSWFIRLFTEPGDAVLDPFAGSGTTLAAAEKLGRDGIGIEIRPEYGAIIEERLKSELFHGGQT